MRTEEKQKFEETRRNALRYDARTTERTTKVVYHWLDAHLSDMSIKRSRVTLTAAAVHRLAYLSLNWSQALR